MSLSVYHVNEYSRDRTEPWQEILAAADHAQSGLAGNRGETTKAGRVTPELLSERPHAHFVFILENVKPIGT